MDVFGTLRASKARPIGKETTLVAQEFKSMHAKLSLMKPLSVKVGSVVQHPLVAQCFQVLSLKFEKPFRKFRNTRMQAPSTAASHPGAGQASAGGTPDPTANASFRPKPRKLCTGQVRIPMSVTRSFPHFSFACPTPPNTSNHRLWLFKPN
eukprot:257488-Amphidinium_carterae.2